MLLIQIKHKVLSIRNIGLVICCVYSSCMYFCTRAWREVIVAPNFIFEWLKPTQYSKAYWSIRANMWQTTWKLIYSKLLLWNTVFSTRIGTFQKPNITRGSKSTIFLSQNAFRVQWNTVMSPHTGGMNIYSICLQYCTILTISFFEGK